MRNEQAACYAAQAMGYLTGYSLEYRIYSYLKKKRLVLSKLKTFWIKKQWPIVAYCTLKTWFLGSELKKLKKKRNVFLSYK